MRVPSAHVDTRGISWADGITPGRTIPISDFYIADPSDSIRAINRQLARGKHLILTPGVYDVARSISVRRPDTVVLGLGLATLTAFDGAIPLKVADRPGIVIAGVTVDAGAVESPVLLQVGRRNDDDDDDDDGGDDDEDDGDERRDDDDDDDDDDDGNRDRINPTTLSDVYFRIGGPLYRQDRHRAGGQ